MIKHTYQPASSQQPAKPSHRLLTSVKLLISHNKMAEIEVGERGVKKNWRCAWEFVV